MNVNDRFRPELHGRAFKDFKRSSRIDTFSSPQAAEKAVRIETIEIRAEGLRQKTKDIHAQRFPAAAKKAYLKLLHDHPYLPQASLGQGPKPPLGATSKLEIYKHQMMERAQRIARLPLLKRLDRIDRAQKNMTRALLNNRQQTLSNKQSL